MGVCLQMSQARHWVYTLHVDVEGKWEEIPPEYLLEDPRMKYHVVQLEKAPTTGKLHLQGYIQFNAPVKFGGVKKINDSAYWAPAKGTPQQCRAYCTKEESRVAGPWEFGSLQFAGKRNDLEEVKEAIVAGKKRKEIIEMFPVAFMKYHSGIEKVINALGSVRSLEVPPLVLVMYGEPGSGKTTRALKGIEKEEIYIKDASQWWDGYNGQKRVVFDEFCGGIAWNTLKCILDKHACQVQIKGGFVQLLAEEFMFTSNKPPIEYYPEVFKKECEWRAFMRRVTQCLYFPEPDFNVEPQEMDLASMFNQ